MLELLSRKSKESAQSATTLDSVMSQFNLSAIATAGGVLGLVTAFTKLCGAMSNFGQQAIQNYAHFESMQKGLETFFQSADKGKAKFEQLRKLSNETTFGVDELANSFTQLANVGVNVDTINDKLVMLGNIAGGDKNKFADLVSIYSKIMSTGKAGSMQIQQLAMRGVPIYDILKKIGVTGQATGDQITKAFQEMTKEGGQFYNAMNNINDTIEGKQGFISDYFKEMTVNFAEASGLADAYKKVLDVLREAIGNLSDKLLEINENPVSKALFQGALIGIIGAITAGLIGGLIPALVAVIGKLTAIAGLTAIINPTAILGGLAIGAVIGITTALSGVVAKQDTINQQLRDEYGLRIKLGQLTPESSVEEKQSVLSELEAQLKQYEEGTVKGAFKEYFDMIETLNQGIERNTEKIQRYQANGVKMPQMGIDYGNVLDKNGRMTTFDNRTPAQRDMESAMRSIVSAQEQLQRFNKDMEKNKYFQSLPKNINSLKEEIELQKQFNSVVKELDDNSPLRKLNKEMKEYESKLEELKSDKKLKGVVSKKLNEETGLFEYKYDLKINIDPTYKAELDSAIRDVENKIRKLNGLNEIKTWQEYWKAVTGVQIGNNVLNNTQGKAIADKTISENRSQLNATKNMLLATGGDNGDVAGAYDDMKNKVDNYIKTLLSTIDSNGNAMFSASDKSIQSLKAFSEELKNESEKLKNLDFKEKLGEIVGNAFYDQASNLGGDVGTFVNSLKSTGNVFIALINTIITALFNVLSEIDGFEETLSPITELFRKLKPLFAVLVDFVKEGEDIMDDVLTPIIGLLNMFGGILKKINPIINAVMRSLLTVFGLFEWLTDVMEELGIVTKSSADAEEEKLKDLTSEYESLLKAMKENQEYYENRKRELNAKSYASDVTSVHDMILTPQGKFSTDPDDYIIASKNPSQLGSSNASVMMNVQINNSMSDNADVRVQQTTDENGFEKLIVNISRKVASDYANGDNGWETAKVLSNVLSSGRSVRV